MTESFVEEFDSFNGSNCVPLKLLTFIPFVVADGLLVRYLSHGINLLLHLIDMAVLQNMEKLISSYCSAFGPSLGRDRLEFSLLVQNLTTYYYYQHYM